MKKRFLWEKKFRNQRNRDPLDKEIAKQKDLQLDIQRREESGIIKRIGKKH